MKEDCYKIAVVADSCDDSVDKTYVNSEIKGDFDEDRMITVIDVLSEIEKLPDYERSIVMAYAHEDPGLAVTIVASNNPTITSRIAQYNAAKKIFNRFVQSLKDKDIVWPPL